MFTHIHTLSLSPSHVERKRVDDLWPSIEIKCIIIRDERSEEKMQNVQTRERELAGTGGRISLYHIFDHSFCASCCVRHFIASTACTRFCIRTANQIHAAESFSRSAEDTTERSRQTTRIHTQGHEATICIRMYTIHMTQHTHAPQSVQNVRFLYHVIHIIHIIRALLFPKVCASFSVHPFACVPAALPISLCTPNAAFVPPSYPRRRLQPHQSRRAVHRRSYRRPRRNSPRAPFVSSPACFS